MQLPEFTTSIWATLAAAAFIMGVSKGGLPGISVIAVPWVAAALGSKTATGFVLPMLIIGDFFALIYFRRAASVKDVLRALPWAVLGVLVGWWILRKIPDGPSKIMDYSVAGIVLFILALQVLKKVSNREKEEKDRSADAVALPSASSSGSVPRCETSQPLPVLQRVFAVFMGFLGGVTTMLANAAGPVMSSYFLSLKLAKKTFIGTCAWFFFTINWFKFPMMCREGMITTQSLKANLILIPMILLGVFAGILVVKRINQKTFEWVVISLAAAGCVKLLI